ncbi:hypothetical protein [Phormidium sp. CCY1219]|uniref:hypothetical protein n=1 Tax=Phormidium sp. CCY1219 TaxID=2886104 RepID=UPI002D1F6BF5|nr:hypothetical protein [Phormidium sp. CCY1219]MEB3826731.1 hypothetical protein [Phormidium sp. CCY1219]
MKQILAAIAGAALLAMGTAAPAASFPSLGDDSDSDLQALIDEGLSFEQQIFGEMIAMDLNITLDQLLAEPTQMDGLYAGDSYSETDTPSGLGVYTKDGCTVDAGCALKAIGLTLTFKCAGSGTDPEAWANCVKDKDFDAYLAASACTYGNCPAFSSVPGQNVLTCQQNPTTPVLAGSSFLPLPTTLNQGSSESLNIDILQQG